MAAIKSNLISRPQSPFEVVSITQRLALRGQGFAAAPEYTKALSRGLVDVFADALMAAALSYAKVLSEEDTSTLLDLYTCTGCAQKVPSLMTDARGDEAAGSPVMSIVLVYSKKGTLSSTHPRKGPHL